MKKLCVLLLVTVCSMSAMAQTTEPVQPGNATCVLGGLVYDANIGAEGKQITGQLGLVVPVGEGPIVLIPHWEFGKYENLAIEGGAIWNLGATGALKLGLLGEIGSSWIRETEGGYIIYNDFTQYVTGAAGGIVGYRFGEVETKPGSFVTLGGWIAAKYRASIDKDDQFNDGVVAGAGVYLGF